MVGYPGDKALVDPIHLWQYEVEGKCAVNYKKGLIDYKIYTTVGMSGSPLFIENENNGEFYVVGIHHGLLKGEKQITGGVYLTEQAQAQIYKWCGKEPQI